jgi:hypothetical protein
VGVDELKFLASYETNAALATIRTARTTLLLAAQSMANIEAPDDQRLDGKALAREFEINTPVKIVYRCGDVQTAEWAEKYSATHWAQVVQRETVKVNQHGGEEWEGTRMMGRLEQANVTQNTLLNLPPRVSVAFFPDRLALKCFTSPVYVDLSVRPSWAKPTVDTQAEPVRDEAGMPPAA